MFTIEHDFEGTIITLGDGVAALRAKDVHVVVDEDATVIEQEDPETGAVKQITLFAA